MPRQCLFSFTTDLDQRGGGHEGLAEIVFNGGVEVCQVGHPKMTDAGKMWTIRGEPGQYDRVHVDEFQSTLSLLL